MWSDWFEYRYQIDQWVVYLSRGYGVGIKSRSGQSLYIPGSIKNNIFMDFSSDDRTGHFTVNLQCEECQRIMLKLLIIEFLGCAVQLVWLDDVVTNHTELSL